MPGGRPPILDEVIGQRPVFDPQTQAVVRTEPLTRMQQIVDDIRVGMNAERACDRAKIPRETVKEWERTAHDARKQLANGARTVERLTDKQQQCVEFSDALHTAELEWHVQMELLLQNLSQGGRRVIVETVKADGDGNMVEQRTQTSYTLPDPKVIQWRLQHRFPDLYALKVEHRNPTDDDGESIPFEVRVQSIGDKLAEFRAARDDPDEQREPPELT